MKERVQTFHLYVLDELEIRTDRRNQNLRMEVMLMSLSRSLLSLLIVCVAGLIVCASGMARQTEENQSPLKAREAFYGAWSRPSGEKRPTSVRPNGNSRENTRAGNVQT